MMLKMHTKDGKWFVNDGNEVRVFDKSLDAWSYIFKRRGEDVPNR